LWLDHSGNYLRFREEWERVYSEGVDELDDGAEKTRPEPSEKEKKEATCPKCEAYFPGYMDVCSNCGHVRERKNKVEAVPGEMEELTTLGARADKQAWWSQLNYFINHHGWSNGRAAHVYREKFGVWPKGLASVEATPSAEVVKFVDLGIKRYIRQMKKAR